MKGITCAVCGNSFNLRSTKARFVTCPDCLTNNLTVQAYSHNDKERERRWKEAGVKYRKTMKKSSRKGYSKKRGRL